MLNKKFNHTTSTKHFPRRRSNKNCESPTGNSDSATHQLQQKTAQAQRKAKNSQTSPTKYFPRRCSSKNC
jgi:hypothetical protein